MEAKSVKIGINITHFRPELEIVDVARKVEDLGFDSFWLPEHIVVPLGEKAFEVQSSYFKTDDPAIVAIKSDNVDPYIALAMSAAVTKRITIGTSISLVPQHNPLDLAQRISTLDHFSRGRFLLGVGLGWLREEGEIMGVDYDHRWNQTKECIQVMKKLWTNDEAEFHGEYYDFPLIRSYPKPAQKPHPPIYFGGTTEKVFKRIITHGNGWLPTAKESLQEISAGRTILNQLAVKASRDPDSIGMTMLGLPQDIDVIKQYEMAGIDRGIIGLAPPSGREILDELEKVAARVKEHLV